MSLLEDFVDQTVLVITADGRSIVGTLRGFDQTINLILEECHERVYSGHGVSQMLLGLYVLRGDNIAAIGELDEVKDKKLDLASVNAPPVKPVVH
jgi:U6 snRNA-associated Sm-like protein LSm8